MSELMEGDFEQILKRIQEKEVKFKEILATLEEEEGGVVFPFTPTKNSFDEKRSIEAAAVFSFLKEKEDLQSIDFVAPLYYPIYVISWSDKNFLFDPTLNFTATFSYVKAPPVKHFITYLKGKSDEDEYIALLKKYESDVIRDSARIEGLISGELKELIESSFIPFLEENRLDGITFPPRMNLDRANEVLTESLSKITSTYEENIKELEEAKEELFSLSSVWIEQLNKKRREVTQAYDENLKKVKDESKRRLKYYEEKMNGFIQQRKDLLRSLEDEKKKIREVRDSLLKSYEKEVEEVRAYLTQITEEYDTRGREIKQLISQYEDERNEKILACKKKYEPEIRKLELQKKNVEVYEGLKKISKKVGTPEPSITPPFDKVQLEKSLKEISEAIEKESHEIRLEYENLISKERERLRDLERERKERIEWWEKKMYSLTEEIKRVVDEKKKEIRLKEEEYEFKVSKIDQELSSLEKNKENLTLRTNQKMLSLEKEKERTLSEINNKQREIESLTSALCKDMEDVIKTIKEDYKNLNLLSVDVPQDLVKKGKFYLEFFALCYTSDDKKVFCVFSPSLYEKRKRSFKESFIRRDYFYFPFKSRGDEKYIPAIQDYIQRELERSIGLYQEGVSKNLLLDKSLLKAGIQILENDGWLGKTRATKLLRDLSM